MATRTAITLVALAVSFLLPAVGQAKPGDVYRKSGGPRVSVKKFRRAPSGFQVCAEYRLSARDVGVIKEQADPKLFDACRRAVLSARRVADDYAGSRGLEDGYLRGYAWGLKKGAYRGYRDKSAVERAKTVAFESPKLAQEVQQASASGRQLGQGDGSAYAKAYFDESFKAQKDPVLDFGKHDVDAPSPDLYPDPHKALYGSMPSRQELIKREAESPSVQVPGSELRPYFKGKKYSIISLYQEKGDHPYDPEAVRNLELARKMSADLMGKDMRSAVDDMNTAQREVYDQSFDEAYDQLAQYAYSRMFYRAVDVGTRHGYELGKKLGSEARYHTSFRTFFNQMYRNQVLESFQQAYLSSYRESFEAHVARLQQGPIIAVTGVEIHDVIDDGITAPGEELKLTVTVENRGLQPAELPVEVRGAVGEGFPSWINVPAFKRVETETEPICAVDRNAEIGKAAAFQVLIDKKGFDFQREIRQVLEVEGIQVMDVDAPHGSAEVKLLVLNPTRRSSGRNVRAVLSVGEAPRASAPVGVLEAGERRDLVLTFKGIDPLLLLDDDSPSEVLLSKKDERLHGIPVSFQMDDGGTVLLRYFDALAYGDGFVPKSHHRDEQILRVQEVLVKHGRQEVNRADDNLWRASPRRTLLGRLVEQYKTAASDARVHYEPLAVDLCKLQESLQRRGWRRSYGALCAQMTGSPLDPTVEAELTVPGGNEEASAADPLAEIDDKE